MNVQSKDLFDNPAGLDGFEFVEFCAPEKGVLEPVFEAMGFTRVAQHRSKDVHLWRQGGINLIANYEPRSAAWYFAREHGPSACGMAFRVRDAAKAYDHLIARGAEPVAVQTGPMELRIPAIRGIGGAILYIVDRYEGAEGATASPSTTSTSNISPASSAAPRVRASTPSITSPTTSTPGA